MGEALDHAGLFEGTAQAAWIQTYTGRQFAPLAPCAADIDIRDIAHALSLLCRYTGHCSHFYSVAEHSVRVSRELPASLQLWGLLHDASEAYLGDLSRPLKHAGGFGDQYREAEQRLMSAIAERFGLEMPEPREVKEMDNVLLFTEQRDLMGRPPKPWRDPRPPLEEIIQPWAPREAELVFLGTFWGLCPDGDKDRPGTIEVQA